ncbi:hypothetical protein M413DRAFT_29277 [Hebeloma cylindrosporum]|uniref:RecF/RecN/SMC N-terminal domain-containing protein n=1 Tax=Hebeloma cylindrosporum TaxID=76867 RepID=A0A0C3BS98_HEBCY|nr:hypothetical protein M413DRAFT_29277 [Hebeloma cylindrosporum h7]
MSKRRSSRSEPEAGPSNLNTAKSARLRSPTRVIDVDADDGPTDCLPRGYTGVPDDELEELEKALILRFEARRVANQGRIGEVATSRIIERVELCQFMCHTYLTFDFGDQLNFIVGQNGSGKSAILAGIAVALGGKAIATGRGTGIRSLIQEGKSKAEVAVVLRNKGEKAYKHELFGVKIIVVRTITLKGASSYKIKSAAGKVIYTTKGEVDAICDYMDIRVDNPITILTQEAAKTFLKSSTPESRYKLFLQGTYLEQLKDDYETAYQHRATIKAELKRKREYGPILLERFHAARNAHREAMEAHDLRSKKDRLLKEMEWVQIAEKEQELEVAYGKLATEEGKIGDAQAELATAKASRESLTVDIATMTDQHEEIKREIEDIRKRMEELRPSIASKKNEMRNLVVQFFLQCCSWWLMMTITLFPGRREHMQDSIQVASQGIQGLDEQLNQESQILEEIIQDRKAAAKLEMDALREKIQNFKDQRASIETALADLRQNLSDANRQRTDASLDFENKKKEDEDLRRRYQTCKSQIRDPLTQYGQNIRNVLDTIKGQQWRGAMPIGPLGMYVTLEDLNYGEVLRQHVGNVLLSFAVTDARDIRPLKEILRKYNNAHMHVIVSSGELFDYTHGEPPSQYLTALRLLKISEPWVTRILIDHCHIERILMAPTRVEAENLLKEISDGVALSSEGFKLRRWKIDGGNKSEGLRDLRSFDKRYSLFRGVGTSTGDLEAIAASGVELQRSLESLESSKSHWQQAVRDIEHKIKEEQPRLRSLDYELRRHDQELQSKMAEDQDESPPALAVLEELRQEKSSEIESFQTQLAHVTNRKMDLTPQITALELEANALGRQVEEKEREGEILVTRIEDKAAKLVEATSHCSYYEKYEADQTAKCRELGEAAREIAAMLEELLEKAPPGGRSTRLLKKADIQKELSNLDRTLTRYETRNPKPIGQIEDELERAKQAHDDFVNSWFDLNDLAEETRNALYVRCDRWVLFRTAVTVQLKNQFMYNLSLRGYLGTMEVDHENGTIELRIQTDDKVHDKLQDLQGSVVAGQKDPAVLSGGEKSLTTLCLLLSLWEVCANPIRCLDEFDVYMDAQNRKVAILMLVNSAKAAAGRQTVIITPHAIDDVYSEPPVVLIKQMADPTRGE